jgi:hypothetical protein
MRNKTSSTYRWYGQIALSFSCVITIVTFAGCRHTQQDDEESLNKQCNVRFLDYLNGDASKARAALSEEINLVENSTVVSPKFKAAFLFMAYARLYALERRLGNDSAADIVYIKVRYWNLRRYELNGLMDEEHLREFHGFTPDKVLESIDKMDKAASQGKGPKYMQQKG